MRRASENQKCRVKWATRWAQEAAAQVDLDREQQVERQLEPGLGTRAGSGNTREQGTGSEGCGHCQRWGWAREHEFWRHFEGRTNRIPRRMRAVKERV